MDQNTYFERNRRIKKKVVIGKLRILPLHVQMVWPPAQFRYSRPVNQTKIKPQQITPEELRKQFSRNESDRLNTTEWSFSACAELAIPFRKHSQFARIGWISYNLHERGTLLLCTVIHNLKSWKRWVLRVAVNMLCWRSGRCVNKLCCVLKNVVFHMRLWLNRRSSNTVNWISMWCGCW